MAARKLSKKRSVSAAKAPAPAPTSAGVAVTLLYFAQLKETAGVGRETLRLPQQATVAQIFARVAERRPALANLLGSCQLAQNGAFVSGRLRIKAGDELAILPPVAGG